MTVAVLFPDEEFHSIEMVLELLDSTLLELIELLIL